MSYAAYAAIINVPGYLSDSAEPPPVFSTGKEAWSYLTDQRCREEDDNPELGHCSECAEYEYSDVVMELAAMALSNSGEGTIYGDTHGSDSPHDQGTAYSVQLAE